MLRWLEAPDVMINLNQGLQNRCSGTGAWFLDSQAFYQWRLQAGSFLWLYGIPGCGKSVLSSSIIDAVSQQYSGDPTIAVLYFIFSFNDQSKQTSEDFVRSLMMQMALQSPKALQSLEQLYVQRGQKLPVLDDLLPICHQMIQSFSGDVYLTIDALDESSEREKVLSLLEGMRQLIDANIHILLASRREQDIDQSLCHLQRDQKICIQSTVVDEDIREYTRQRLRKDMAFDRWRKDPALLEEIEDKVTAKADGM